MSIPYLKAKKWQQLTRDERFYCFALYSHAAKNPAAFAEFVIKEARLDCASTGQWDIGVEVCFYRDYRWHQGLGVKESEFSEKRTFDLCLFGETDLIIIEAKCDQGFDKRQLKSFAEDVVKLPKLLGGLTPSVHLVALASSKYIKRQRPGGTLRSAFGDHVVSWRECSALYEQDPLLAQADALYRSKERVFLPDELAPTDGP